VENYCVPFLKHTPARRGKLASCFWNIFQQDLENYCVLFRKYIPAKSGKRRCPIREIYSSKTWKTVLYSWNLFQHDLKNYVLFLKLIRVKLGKVVSYFWFTFRRGLGKQHSFLTSDLDGPNGQPSRPSRFVTPYQLNRRLSWAQSRSRYTDEGSKYRNVGKLLSDYKASYQSRQYPPLLPTWELKTQKTESISEADTKRRNLKQII
jgi:hypothetical protein